MNLNDTNEILVNGEALLAITGFDPVLKKGPVKISQLNMKRAANLSSQVYRMCKEFLTEKEFMKGSLDLPKIDFLEMLDAINATVDENWLADKISEVPEWLQPDYALVLGQAFEHLRQAIPVLPVSITSRQTRPSDFQLSRFNRAYRTISNPMSVMDDLLKGFLSRSQVDTLITVYPELYSLIKDNLMLVATELTAKNKDYQVPYNKLKQISVLLLSSVVPPDLQTVLQANFIKQEEPANSNSGAPNPAEASITKMQAIDQK